MATLEQNIEKMEAQLKLWNAKMNELIARGKVSGHELKIEAGKRIDDLRAALDAAETQLIEVKKAGAGQWDNFRAAVEGAWKRAEAAFKKLAD